MNLDEQLVLLTPEQLQGLLRQAWTSMAVEEYMGLLTNVPNSSDLISS